MNQLPLDSEVFTVEGQPVFLILPAQSAHAGPMPWVWYAPTLPMHPGDEERWMFERFAAAGMAIAGIDAGESYGSPACVALFDSLYTHLTRQRGLATKPALLARSRGGLMLYNWAARYADCVACIAGIYPVCNLASYPGLEHAAPAYEMTEQALADRLDEFNPIDRLAPLAAASVPIFHIHGDNDAMVPIESNSGMVKTRYDGMGGKMELQLVDGGGHDLAPHWFESQALLDFVIRHTCPETET